MFLLLYKKAYSKAAKEWGFKNIYEKKTTNYGFELMELTIASCETEEASEPCPKICRSIAPTCAPPLQQLLQTRR